MKTKILILFAAVLMCNLSLNAQQYQQEADLTRSIIGKAKKDFVTAVVDIPSDKSDLFWTYYNAYDAERTNIANESLNLLNTYTSMYGSEDPKGYKNIARDVNRIHRLNDKNLFKYYKKINKKVGSKTAMQFFQVEEYLRSKIESKLYENLPINR